MDGFDCDFTEKPPKVLQTHCPICLLILREPFQVTCCGKSFCRACIQRIGAENKPCPTCNQDNFDCFQNKGLQQPLYGFQVFCSNKERGCDWQGELGKLDKHLNSNPDKDNLSVGCAFVNVQCAFCNVLYQRSKIECHQDSQCPQRPFTCSMCQEFKSTYDDVSTNHAPVCKWRPVECPNSCGVKNLQHQHLEEHVSTQCPLSYVDCEFSDAGCDVKVHRKDLPSHLGENVVTHVSLLARENRKLKLQLKQQEQQFKLHFRLPPIRLECAKGSLSGYRGWVSEPFYSNIGGYKLQLFMFQTGSDHFTCMLMEIEFPVVLPCTQQITMRIMDQDNDKNYHKIVQKYTVPKYNTITTIQSSSKGIIDKYLRKNKLVICVDEIKTL